FSLGMRIAKHGFDGVSVVAGQVLEMIHFEFGLAIEPKLVSSPGLYQLSSLRFSFESKGFYLKFI
ncbi:MAG: hypothetical protein QNK61_12390, partial [Akkermansiaceae bacterium]